MTIQWLGQAGLLFQMDHFTVMVDPYLSDSVAKINPNNTRRIAVEESIFSVRPDVMIFTHNHRDHYDPETVERFLSRYDGITVLSPTSVWCEVRKFGGNHNYVQFNVGTEWSEEIVCFKAVPAVHSDPLAIGVIIEIKGKRYYVTGDTLYNETVLKSVPEDIEVVFLPINGVGNNMNMLDAARFASAIKAKSVVPIHFGLFDNLCAEAFSCENKIVPEIYKTIVL